MFSGDIRRLLIQVISSWQVIAVTVVLVIYIFIINYVARTYNRNPRVPLIPKGKKKKSGTPPPPATDELNLEEESKK